MAVKVPPIVPILPAPPVIPPYKDQWPSGTYSWQRGRWADKAIVSSYYGPNTIPMPKVWWLDRDQTLHLVLTDSAFLKWFQETRTKPYDGYTTSYGAGYATWLASRPIGATIDDNTSPAQAYAKRPSYAGAVKGGFLMVTSPGTWWWLEPGKYPYTAHWIASMALVEKYFGPYGTKATRWPSGILDPHPIGDPITR